MATNAFTFLRTFHLSGGCSGSLRIFDLSRFLTGLNDTVHPVSLRQFLQDRDYNRLKALPTSSRSFSISIFLPLLVLTTVIFSGLDTSHHGVEGHTDHIPVTAQTVTAALTAAVPVVRSSFESADKDSVVAAHNSVGVSHNSVEAAYSSAVIAVASCPIFLPNGPRSSAMPH